jgi:hypothetical protein
VKRHPALWLTIVLAAFYIFLGNGRISSGDGEAMLQVTRALAQQGRLDLQPGTLAPVETVLAESTYPPLPYTLVGQDERTYSKYGLGQSLAALPLYLLGMAWQAVTDIDHAPRSAALWLNSLLTAGTAGLLVALARDLDYSTRTGVLLALAFALCSPAWVYTHSFFSEPLVTFCLAGATLSAVRLAKGDRGHWLVLASGALGLALLTRVNAVAALPAFGLYVVLIWHARDRLVGVTLGQVTAALLAFSLGAGLMLLYNVIRTGGPMDFGYHTPNWQTPLLRGLYGLTFSPGKGIVWYAPVIMLGLFGLRPFFRQWPREALLCTGVSAGYLLLHSVYTHWAGGWCWGPRLVLPALPFLLLPACALLDQHKLPRAAELALALILVLGLVVQIPAVGGSYALTLQRTYQASPAEFYNRVYDQPRYSPLIGQWTSFLQVTANLREARARGQLTALMDQTEPAEDILLLADTPSEALRIQWQTALSYNLPDLWVVSAPWLRRDGSP